MTLKLKQLVDNVGALKDLSQTKLPIKISFRVSKLISQVQNELEIYEKQRVEIVKKLGEENPDGSWQVKVENMPEYNKEVETLGDVDVTIDFEKIKIDELGQIIIEPKNLVEFLFE